mgnify:FL=1
MAFATVQSIDKQVVLHAEALVHLPADRLRALLVDFENLPQVITDLREVQILTADDDGTACMRVVARIRIAFFRLNPTWIQQVRVLPSGEIEAVINAEPGELPIGTAHWRLFPQNGNTLLAFDARLNPKFWFPPAIGTLLIQRMLKKEAAMIAKGLERVAASQSCS